MKYILLRQMLLVLTILSPASDINADEKAEYDLTLTIHCPSKRIKQGDEIPIVFTITNTGRSTYSYNTRNYDRSGRMREYKLVAKREDSTTVHDPRGNYVEGLGGGLGGGTGTIATGQSFSRTIALNRWALINKPSRYSVTGTYAYHVKDPNASERYNISILKTGLVKSAPIEIVVNPRGRWQMGWYIKKLQKNLKAIKPSSKWETVEQREAIITKMAYTCDDRIVPTLINLMYKNYHGNEVFRAREAFLCYLPRGPKVKNAILQESMKRGLAPGMQSVLEKFGCSKEEFKKIITTSLTSDNLDILDTGVLAAQKHPDDEHMSKLILIAMDHNRLRPDRHFSAVGRDRAIYAIAFNRTEEGVKALKALLKDSDRRIRQTTQHAIRQAYRRHPVYPKDLGDEYTARLVTIAMDTNDPWQIFMIAEIARSRTIEGVEAIKMLLEDPDKDIALAETDRGVKVIQDLLRDPNKDNRKKVAEFIRYVYKEYPGRPLRNDDFGDEFREDPDERTRKVLEGLKNQ